MFDYQRASAATRDPVMDLKFLLSGARPQPRAGRKRSARPLHRAMAPRTPHASFDVRYSFYVAVEFLSNKRLILEKMCLVRPVMVEQ